MGNTDPLPSDTPSTPGTERWVMIAAVLASGMTLIDETALNLALPAIQMGLGASGFGLLWVVNAYAVVLTAFLLAGGALGDRRGRKRVLAVGIGIFTAASLGCGLAPSIEILIGVRAVQGVGAALMVPGGLALLIALIPPNKHGKALGIWSAWCVVVAALGPILGGLLARAGLWRGIFFINVPLGLLALTILARCVPESRRLKASTGVDYLGAIAAVVGLACLNYGLIAVADQGTSDRWGLLAVGAGLTGLVAFVIVERYSAHPLLPLDLFRSRRFLAATLLTLSLFTAFRGLLFFLPLNLIQVQGYDASLAGLAQLPVMLCLVLMSRQSGRLTDALGPRSPLVVGCLLAGAGFLLFARPGVTEGPSDFWSAYLPALCLLGIGFAVALTPLNALSMSALPPGRSGLASGVSSTISRLSGVLAIVVVGTVALASFGRFLDARIALLGLAPEAARTLHDGAGGLCATPVPDGLDSAAEAGVRDAIRRAFVDTFRLVCAIAAGLAWLGALAATLLPRGRPQAIEDPLPANSEG